MGRKLSKAQEEAFYKGFNGLSGSKFAVFDSELKENQKKLRPAIKISSIKFSRIQDLEDLNRIERESDHLKYYLS